MGFFSDFLYKGICCEYLFELHQQVDAIQMSTHNICLYKEVKKKYIDCNLKTMEFLDCGLIGVCVVIRSNTVSIFWLRMPYLELWHYHCPEILYLPQVLGNLFPYHNLF